MCGSGALLLLVVAWRAALAHLSSAAAGAVRRMDAPTRNRDGWAAASGGPDVRMGRHTTCNGRLNDEWLADERLGGAVAVALSMTASLLHVRWTDRFYFMRRGHTAQELQPPLLQIGPLLLFTRSNVLIRQACPAAVCCTVRHIPFAGDCSRSCPAPASVVSPLCSSQDQPKRRGVAKACRL